MKPASLKGTQKKEIPAELKYRGFPVLVLVALAIICTLASPPEVTNEHGERFERRRDLLEGIVPPFCLRTGAGFTLAWVHRQNWNPWNSDFAMAVLFTGLQLFLEFGTDRSEDHYYSPDAFYMQFGLCYAYPVLASLSIRYLTSILPAVAVLAAQLAYEYGRRGITPPFMFLLFGGVTLYVHMGATTLQSAAMQRYRAKLVAFIQPKTVPKFYSATDVPRLSHLEMELVGAFKLPRAPRKPKQSIVLKHIAVGLLCGAAAYYDRYHMGDVRTAIAEYHETMGNVDVDKITQAEFNKLEMKTMKDPVIQEAISFFNIRRHTPSYFDYFAVLGLERGATNKEIKKQFREKSRVMHPDKNPNDPNAERNFKLLQRANDILTKKAARKLYLDQLRREEVSEVSKRTMMLRWIPIAFFLVSFLLLEDGLLRLVWGMIKRRMGGETVETAALKSPKAKGGAPDFMALWELEDAVQEAATGEAAAGQVGKRLMKLDVEWHAQQAELLTEYLKHTADEDYQALLQDSREIMSSRARLSADSELVFTASKGARDAVAAFVAANKKQSKQLLGKVVEERMESNVNRDFMYWNVVMKLVGTIREIAPDVYGKQQEAWDMVQAISFKYVREFSGFLRGSEGHLVSSISAAAQNAIMTLPRGKRMAFIYTLLRDLESSSDGLLSLPIMKAEDRKKSL